MAIFFLAIVAAALFFFIALIAKRPSGVKKKEGEISIVDSTELNAHLTMRLASLKNSHLAGRTTEEIDAELRSRFTSLKNSQRERELLVNESLDRELKARFLSLKTHDIPVGIGRSTDEIEHDRSDVKSRGSDNLKKIDSCDSRFDSDEAEEELQSQFTETEQALEEDGEVGLEEEMILLESEGLEYGWDNSNWVDELKRLHEIWEEHVSESVINSSLETKTIRRRISSSGLFLC
ncbi:uncharacterized protein LOC144704884 [Wolffia australiana]